MHLRLKLSHRLLHRLRAIQYIKQTLRLKQVLAGVMALILVITMASPSISQGRENYGEALQKSILFYEAQQAGKLPEWNRFPWRGDSTLEDGSNVGVDLSGGWVDAGDNVKFNYPMANTVVNLAWGGIEYYEAYQKSGQLVHLSQNIKWATDYLVNSFANDNPGEYLLYGQVGNGKKDHKWWGPLEVVHYEMERPVYKIDTSCPGTDLAAETAAALASSSMLFRRNGNLEYADLLVQKAERLFDFADRYRGKYSDCLTEANPFYTSGGLAFLVKWASLPLTANTSFIAFVYGDWLKTQGEFSKARRYFDFGASQINYILGRNPSRRSYLIGYGENYPQNPHHRTAHGSWLNNISQPVATRNLLMGALVGGPDQQDNWKDDRGDWVQNEVGVGYNAGFTSALAKMYSEFGGEPLAKISFPEVSEPEIFVESQIAPMKQATEINLTIVNQSTAPARGLKNPLLRVFYKSKSGSGDRVSVSTVSNDCPQNSSSVPVQLKNDVYYRKRRL